MIYMDERQAAANIAMGAVKEWAAKKFGTGMRPAMTPSFKHQVEAIADEALLNSEWYQWRCVVYFDHDQGAVNLTIIKRICP